MSFSRTLSHVTGTELSVYEWWFKAGKPRCQVILNDPQKDYQVIINPRGSFVFYPKETALQALGIGERGLGPIDPCVIKGSWEEILAVSISWNNEAFQ